MQLRSIFQKIFGSEKSYAGAGLLGWTAGSMIGHDKILGTLLQQIAGSWAPISLQILLAAAVIAIGLWMSRKRVVQ